MTIHMTGQWATRIALTCISPACEKTRTKISLVWEHTISKQFITMIVGKYLKVSLGWQDTGRRGIRRWLTGTVACWRFALFPLPSVWPHPVIKQTGLFVWSDLTTFRSALNSGGGRQIFWTKLFKVSGVFNFSITISLVTSDLFHSKLFFIVRIAVRIALKTYGDAQQSLQLRILENIFLFLPAHIHFSNGQQW